MHRRLAAIDQHRNAARMRDANHVLDRDDGAERVRHLRDRHHLGARRQKLLEFVEQEIAVVIDRRPFDDGALPLAQEMPRHDVGVVLHDRQHHLVALLQPRAAEGRRDEIKRLGGVAGEDDLFLARRVEERAHGLARRLVGFRRLVGEEVQPAMHVGVFARIRLLDAVEHRLRLLRRGGVVEINERLAVDLHRQRRKIRADALDVITAVVDCRVHQALLACNQPSAAASRLSRSPSCATCSTTSPTNAVTINASASFGGMPRALR